MFIEYGLISEESGMERVYTVIPENLRFCPTCPCATRTCPNHGFCMYCKKHHEAIDCILEEKGLEPEGPYCKRSQQFCE